MGVECLRDGVYTLSHSGSSGIRLWQTQNPASTNAPLLVCGQTVTNGVNGVQFLSGADSAIHWSVASGGVTFYGGHGTGREAIIKGGATESDFKLEVEVDGLPLAVKPYIHGRVLEPKTVPVRAYIICDSNGVPAVTTATINDWIAEANRIYRQVAVTFTLASVTTVENQDWFDIGDTVEFYLRPPTLTEQAGWNCTA